MESLYFSDASFLQDESIQRVDGKYCIGPSCGVIYWDGDVGPTKYYRFAKPNRGPCKASYNHSLSKLRPVDNLQGEPFPNMPRL